MTSRTPLSRVINPASIKREGTPYKLVATVTERADIAEFLGLLELRHLSAELTLARSASGIIAVTGHIKADLAQSCVVTLESVPQLMVEEIDRRFVPDGPAGSAPHLVDVVLDERDPPDTYGNIGIDIGAAAVEQLSLGLDPYPRAQGAELPEAVLDRPAADDLPFAVLKSVGHSDRS